MEVIEAQCSWFWRLTITSISNMCERSQCSVACMGMQATLAVVSWMPMMVAMLTV
jgi:hypothetical protein